MSQEARASVVVGLLHQGYCGHREAVVLGPKYIGTQALELGPITVPTPDDLIHVKY